MSAPIKPLPQTHKSAIVAQVEKDKDLLTTMQQRAAGKFYGDDGFSVEPRSMFTLDIAFPKELPQCPVVLYSIQSTCECPVFHFLTQRSARGFSVTIHNTDESKKFEGTVMWLAFVQP